MGYGEVLLGHLVRGKLVDDRIDDWRTRLQADHDLTAAELDTLAPYIEYVSHYGSRTELLLLVLVFSPFVVVLLALAGFGLFGSLGSFASALFGGQGRVLVITGGIFALMALLPIGLLGVVVYVLWRRWKRYRFASEIESYLTSEPRRLCEDDDPLPRSREEIADASKSVLPGD